MYSHFKIIGQNSGLQGMNARDK